MKRLPATLGILVLLGILFVWFRPSIPMSISAQDLKEVVADSTGVDTTTYQPTANKRTRSQEAQPVEEKPLPLPESDTPKAEPEPLTREEKDARYRENQTRYRQQASRVKENLRAGETYVYEYDIGDQLTVRVTGFEPSNWPDNGDVRPKRIHLEIKDGWRRRTLYTTLNRDGRAADIYGSVHDGLKIYIEMDMSQVTPCPKFTYDGIEMIPKGKLKWQK